MRRRKGEPTKPHSKKRSLGAISLLQRRIINMVASTGGRELVISASELERSAQTVNQALLGLAARDPALIFFVPRPGDSWWVSLTDEGMTRSSPEHRAMAILASDAKPRDRFWQPQAGSNYKVKFTGNDTVYTNTAVSTYTLSTSTVSATSQTYVSANAPLPVQNLPKTR